MTDIYVSIVGMAVLCTLIIVVGARLARRLPRSVNTLLTGCAFLGLVAFERWLNDSPWLTRLIPLATVPVWGAWQPAIASLGIAFGWTLLPGAAWRRLVLVIPLLLLTGMRAWFPIFDQSPPVTARTENGVWMQTTGATCSPAAAATLLGTLGINTSEKEMASACLTSLNGTSMLGLYRGMKLKTIGHDLKVVAAKDMTEEDLQKLSLPALLSVYLIPGALVDPRYTELWGWGPGVKHTVVFLGFAPNGEIELADPAVGLENWDVENLNVLWHGEAIYLEQPTPVPGKPAILKSLRGLGKKRARS